MKLIENVEFETLEFKLNRASRRYVIDARLESYSCKMVQCEKKQFKELLSQLEKEGTDQYSLKLSPSCTIRALHEKMGERLDSQSYVMSTYQTEPCGIHSVKSRSRNTSACSESEESPIKPHHSMISAKHYFFLKSAINMSFSDNSFDFMETDSDDYCLEPELGVIRGYISRLAALYIDKYQELSADLWSTIEKEIHPNECVIYSYKPNHNDDPYSRRCIASFNYFFFNLALKRIVFFSVIVKDEYPGDDLGEMDDLY